MSQPINWDDESAAYIGSRVERYPDGLNIELAWVEEVMTDPDLVAMEPDPKSRVGAARFIGEAVSAGRVLVVIAYRDLDGDLHGINAWPATGQDLRIYLEGSTNGQDD